MANGFENPLGISLPQSQVPGPINVDALRQAQAQEQLQGMLAAPAAPAPVQESAPSFVAAPTSSERDAMALQQIQQQRLAQAAALPDNVVLGTSSTSAALSRAQAAEAKARNEALTQARIESEQQAEGRRQQIDVLNQQVMDDAVGNMRTLSEQLGKRSPALRRRAQEAEKAFEEINAEVKSSKVDPDRLIASMPSWGQALMAIATGFDALNRSLPGNQARGPSVYGIVQAAINRDLQVQRANLNQRMRQLGVADRERRFALDRFDKIQQEQRQAANSLTQLKLAQIAGESKSIDRQLRSANAVLNFRAADAAERTRLDQLSRGRTTVQRGRNPLKAQLLASGGQKLTKQESETVIGSTQATEELADIVKELNKVRKKSGAIFAAGKSFIPGTVEKALKGRVAGAVLKLAKAAQGGGVVTDADAKRLEAAVPNLFLGDAALRASTFSQIEGFIRPIKIRAREAVADGRLGAAARQLRSASQLEKTLQTLKAQMF